MIYREPDYKDLGLRNFQIRQHIACSKTIEPPCDKCGFAPCICKFIVGFNPETRIWIVDDKGELS